MNALVSMHGVWLLLFVPAGAIVAWRYAGPIVRNVSIWLTLCTAISLLGWFGFLAVNGTDSTITIFDRLLYASAEIFGSISVPIVQLLFAFGVVVAWPKRWAYSCEEGVRTASAEVQLANVTE